MNMHSTHSVPLLEPDVSVKLEREYLVVVYNNEFNTYDEVMFILQLATQCDEEEAEIETWEIDHLGKSVVHCSSESECTTVANIIRTIGIRVEVIKDI